MNSSKQVQRRQLVPDKHLSTFPYCCILQIEILFNDEFKVTATSFLIASNLMLTSANCFIRKQKKDSTVQLISVCCEGRKIIVSAQNVKLNQKFVNEMKQEKKQMWGQSLRADFGLILLPQKIRRSQYFSLKAQTSQKQEQINVCGFVQTNSNYKLYEHSNKIKIYKNLGYYDIDIGKGQRGSPVFFVSKPSQVIGIHKGNSSLSNLKICCLVTKYLIQTVQKWKQEWNVTNQEPEMQQDRVQILQTHLQQFVISEYTNQVIKGSYQVVLYKLIHQRQSCSDLQVLSLQGERMQDKGIEELCCCQLPNIQKVNLNDNLISMAGAVRIVQNKWNEQATYILDSVITKEGGYALNVGHNIPLIKSFIKDDQISFSRIDAFDDSKQLYQGLQLMMEMPLMGCLQSAEIQLQMKETAQEGDQRSLERLLLTMKQILGKSAVTFSRKSNIKSQLTWKVLTADLMNKRVMIKHKITTPEWDFKDFQNNSKQVLRFKDWYLKKLAQEYNADISDLTIHKLTEGSVEVELSMHRTNNLAANPQFSRERIQIIPFFKGFELSPDEFDSWYQYEYSKGVKVQQLQRGGIPFFRPIHCKKFAIKVQSLYDGGNNDWLNTQNPNQWAIAYHGLKYPDSIVPAKNQSVLKSIMDGRERGEMLQIGKAQWYKDQDAINKPGEKVGEGIYLSPYFTVCLFDYAEPTEKNNQTYRVVLMVRIRPAALKITTSEETYWVINESKDVRPCGILLFTEEQYQALSELGKSIYGEAESINVSERPCHWQRWRHNYQQFRRDNNLV